MAMELKDRITKQPRVAKAGSIASERAVRSLTM